MGSGIVFPLDPVFSEAVKTSFSFLHESVLHAEENVPTMTSSADMYKTRPQLDVEFGDFSDSLQYEVPCDKTVNLVENNSRVQNINHDDAHLIDNCCHSPPLQCF